MMDGDLPERRGDLPARRAGLARAGVFALVLLAGVFLAYLWGEQSGIVSMRQSVEHRLDIYTGGLQSELTRYDYLPGILSLNKDVIALLRQPDDPALLARVNAYLETVNQKAGSSDIYVMDMSGLTLAASNWNRERSFVGKNFAYRPYFIDAARGLPGRFYGIGTVSQSPGYYFSYGIYRDGVMIGVAALKVDLDKLDDVWARADDNVAVADENGVIFLASVPHWKFKALAALSPETLAKLAETRQYQEAGTIHALGLQEERILEEGTSFVSLRDGSDAAGDERRFLRPRLLMQSRAVPGTHWTLMILSDTAPITARARNSALVVAFMLGFLGVLALYLRQRRRAIAQSLAARAALQRAHDELERKVAMRTEDLSNANRHLQTEIAERRRAEEVLKATMDELVQAGKMAALGQMSAGITHELNQPLAALRTLSDNAVVLLRRGRSEDAQENLAMIGQLIARMGKITGQLKKFARKSPAQLVPTPIAGVVADAVFLIEQRLRDDRIALELDIPPGSAAYCDGNRLEQVLVNLLGNAVDAMRAHPVAAGDGAQPRRIRIEARTEGGWTTVRVRDGGPGLPQEVRQRLFEPFFTTKEQGAGLGLGLAISAGIVREFGGRLDGANHPQGGAEFSVRLRAARIEETEHV